MDRTPAHLADMLRFTQELRSLANGHTLETFTSNRVLCLAVEKLFINLGEAAYRVDSESASQWPDIPWRRVIGLRNILIHGYASVNDRLVWDVASGHLPQLAVRLEQRLANTPP